MQPLRGGVCPACGQDQASYRSAPHQLRPGTELIDRYLLGRVLGEGGFGITYIGRDRKLDCPVTIKEYYPVDAVSRTVEASDEVLPRTEADRAFLEKGKERFLTEARTLAKFSQEESIVSVRDFFSANGTAYFVMDYLDGRNLSDWLAERGPMSFPEVFALLTPVMDALDKIHAQGMIHRDISPSNIMVLRSGGVRLLDFGAARSENTAGRTLSVQFKPGYAPEEQYRSKGMQGPWTDVYGLSATMYKLLTGNTPEDAMNRLYADELEPIRKYNPSVTEAQEAVVRRGMAIHQEERFPSVQALRDACAECLNGAVSAAPTAPDAPPPDADSRTVSGVDTTPPRPQAEPEAPEPAPQPQPEEIIEEAPAGEPEAEPPAPAREKREKRRKRGGKRFLTVLGVLAALAAIAVVGRIVLLSLTTVSVGDQAVSRKEKALYLAVDQISDQDMQNLKKLPLLEELRLSNCFLDDADVAVLSELTQLRRLVISGNHAVTDVSPLTALENLEDLDISDTGVEDVSCLAQMETLKKLNLSDTEHLNPATIQLPEQLEDLIIRNISLTDVSFLAPAAGTLFSLDLSGNALSDLSPLADCGLLTELTLSGNSVSDLSPLACCEALAALDLDDNSVSDLSPLAGCILLHELSLRNNAVQDLSPLPVTTLLNLDLAENDVEDISRLQGAIALTSLDLSGNRVSDLTPLADHTPLRSLDLSGNQITDLSPLQECFKIADLKLSNNQISDVSVLPMITDLALLRLDHNLVEDISPLAQCQTLRASDRTLDLRRNQIADVSALKGYQCKRLLLSDNRITDVSPLAECSQASMITLNSNQIEDASPLFGLPSLASLQIVDNPVSDLSGLWFSQEGVDNALFSFGKFTLSMSYSPDIDWAALLATENLRVVVCGATPREQDALKEYNNITFLPLEELLTQESEAADG